MTKSGFLINIEGIDGSGKSLLTKNLKEKIKSPNVIFTFEPGDTILGKKLRHILHEEKETTCDLSEYLLFAADRAQHFEQTIIPALKENKIIISDRLADSSLAYQGFARGLDTKMIKKVNSWAMQNIEPNLTLYVEVDLKIAMQRIFKRNEDLTSFEKEKTNFWEKVIEGYKQIFETRKNVITIDGNKKPEEVCRQALEAINNMGLALTG